MSHHDILTNIILPSSYLSTQPQPRYTLFPYTTLFRSEARILLYDYYRNERSRTRTRPSGSGLSESPKALQKCFMRSGIRISPNRSEEHTSELQSRVDLVCRLLLEKKNKKI